MHKTNKLFETYKRLSTHDLDLLHHLYLNRCLTYQQAITFIYQSSQSIERFYRSTVKRLIKLGVVERMEYKPHEYVLFLTTLGVDIVRENKEIPYEIFNPDTKIVKRGYYRAGELKMNPRLVNHQVHLNQFVLEFKERAKERGLKWKYYDEKYVSQYFTIRPDGLIQLMDTDFFLEMDMGTESKKQLIDKWNNYRDFVRTGEFTNRERKIMILFITENVKNVEGRKDLVRFTVVQQMLDLLNESFDMVVGSKNELLDMMMDTLIPNIQEANPAKHQILDVLAKKHSFKTDLAYPLREALNEMDYEFYIRKTNPGNNRIVQEDGRLQEYVLDDYTHEPMSILNRIQFHEKSANVFELHFKRRVGYIVVVNDIEKLKKDLKIADSMHIEQVYFTTHERLAQLPFPQALFQFDANGEIESFSDYSLQKRMKDPLGQP